MRTHRPLAEPFLLLVAEDSEADRMLLQDVFDELNFHVNLSFVGNGEELLAYLRRLVDTGELPSALPGLILMDLNMPRMKGIEALRALRSDPALRVLPVIVLSTSNHPRQIAQAYAHGVNAYLTKPEDFGKYVELVERFGNFWLHSAKLPTLIGEPSSE